MPSNGSRRWAVCWVRGDLALFRCHQPCNLRPRWPEPHLTVEPERARINRLIVVEAELIRVNRNASHTNDLMQQPKHRRVHPGRLSVAECVERVETDFHSLADRNAFDVVDRNSILQCEPGMISAQRQASLGRQNPAKNFNAPSGAGLSNTGPIAMSASIPFPVPA